jgi:hypothetical protein
MDCEMIFEAAEWQSVWSVIPKTGTNWHFFAGKTSIFYPFSVYSSWRAVAVEATSVVGNGSIDCEFGRVY